MRRKGKKNESQKIESLVEQYSYWVEWSEEDQAHLGRCFEFPSLSAHAEKSSDAFEQIKLVVAESIKWMLEENEPLPEPLGKRKFKGHFTLRIPSDLHRELALKAMKDGVSLNQLILSRL